MGRLNRALVLAVVALWVIMSNHCHLEALPGFSALACESEAEPGPAGHHGASDCGNQDACGLVETGFYRGDDEPARAPQHDSADLPPVLVAWAAILTPLPGPALKARPPDARRPDLAPAWRFLTRAALPPRAPSFAS